MAKRYVIEKFGAFGEGVAHDEGKVIFITGALPGEEVLATPTLVKKSFTKAKLNKVLSPSKDRVKPPCKYFYRCGGCGLQHLSYSVQLDEKAQSVAQTIQKVAGLSVQIDGVISSPKQYRYRNKLSFPVRGKAIGLYEESSHSVVDITDCMLQKEWNVSLISALRAFMADYKYSGYDERSGEIRHIVAREKDGSICITLVTSSRIKIDGFLSYIPFDNFVLYQNVNGTQSNVILSDEFYLIGGKGIYPDFHPASFYQVNDDIEDRLYGDVLAEIKGGTVIDAFCGAGNLTLKMAQVASEVYGIEIVPQAIAEAKDRANKKRAFNATFICGDCKNEFPRLSKTLSGDITVVFDPPRKGVDENSLRATIDLAPQKIVYVSCNPATLARDLSILSPYYKVQSVRVYDMFPQTVHVETVVCLIRQTN